MAPPAVALAAKLSTAKPTPRPPGPRCDAAHSEAPPGVQLFRCGRRPTSACTKSAVGSDWNEAAGAPLFALEQESPTHGERFEWNEQFIFDGRRKSCSVSRAPPSTLVSHGDCVAWRPSFKTRPMSSRATKRIFLRCPQGGTDHRATWTGANLGWPRGINSTGGICMRWKHQGGRRRKRRGAFRISIAKTTRGRCGKVGLQPANQACRSTKYTSAAYPAGVHAAGRKPVRRGFVQGNNGERSLGRAPGEAAAMQRRMCQPAVDL